MTVEAVVCAFGIKGITEASITRRPLTPITLNTNIVKKKTGQVFSYLLALKFVFCPKLNVFFFKLTSHLNLESTTACLLFDPILQVPIKCKVDAAVFRTWHRQYSFDLNWNPEQAVTGSIRSPTPLNSWELSIKFVLYLSPKKRWM